MVIKSCILHKYEFKLIIRKGVIKSRYLNHINQENQLKELTNRPEDKIVVLYTENDILHCEN